MRATFEIDGARITSLEQFFDEISRVLVPDVEWGRNLDALDDILRGGFGTPDEGFVLRWKNHELSRARLGYPETVRQLTRRLERCHASHRDHVSAELERARSGVGPTVFDWLVEIVNHHADAGVELELV